MIYIFTLIDIVLTALFAILGKYTWGGFAYFVLSLLLVLSLVWAGYFIYQYFTSFRREIDEQYQIFKVEKINKLKITKDEFEEYEETYKKEFKRSVVKQSFVKWFIILFCFAIAAAFLSSMILYK